MTNRQGNQVNIKSKVRLTYSLHIVHVKGAFKRVHATRVKDSLHCILYPKAL